MNFPIIQKFDNILYNLSLRVFQDLSHDELAIVDMRERDALKRKYMATYLQEKKDFLSNLR